MRVRPRPYRQGASASRESEPFPPPHAPSEHCSCACRANVRARAQILEDVRFMFGIDPDRVERKPIDAERRRLQRRIEIGMCSPPHQ